MVGYYNNLHVGSAAADVVVLLVVALLQEEGEEEEEEEDVGTNLICSSRFPGKILSSF